MILVELVRVEMLDLDGASSPVFYKYRLPSLDGLNGDGKLDIFLQNDRYVVDDVGNTRDLAD